MCLVLILVDPIYIVIMLVWDLALLPLPPCSYLHTHFCTTHSLYLHHACDPLTNCRFYSELQSFEANMRSGGQGGMNPHLKKRKK